MLVIYFFWIRGDEINPYQPNPTQNTPRIQKMRRICTSTFITGRAEPPLTTVEPGARSRISAIFFAGRRNSAGSSGGCSSSAGAYSAPFRPRVRRALAPRSSLEIRGVPSSGAGPSQNGTCLGGGIGSKIRAGRNAVNYFRFGSTRVCIRRSVCTE